MGEPTSVKTVLSQATALYDNPNLPLAHLAETEGWRQGFTSGAAWMKSAMSHLRGETPPAINISFQQLGFIKYGAAGTGSLFFLIVIGLTQTWYLLWIVVFIFYLIEVQMVFLFPLAIDGAAHPFHESLRWTRRAGGTLRVMLMVMPLAAVMLFGGFLGQGFVRSWSLGCLAVVVWYETLRTDGRFEHAQTA